MHLATDAQPKTRIWATAQDRVQSVWSEPTLTCSPRRRYAESCSRTASGSGVFLSEDPIDSKGAFNLYAYVGNQPTMALDPTGAVRKCVHATTYQDIGAAAWTHHFGLAPSPPPPSYRNRFNLITFDPQCDCGQKIDATSFSLKSSPTRRFWGPNPTVQWYVVNPPGNSAYVDVSVSTRWVVTVSPSTFKDYANDLELCYDCN